MNILFIVSGVVSCNLLENVLQAKKIVNEASLNLALNLQSRYGTKQVDRDG